MTRVQIPAYTDRWAMGDRYGEIVKIGKTRPSAFNRTDWLASNGGCVDGRIEYANVKLDKSGKTVRFILADCEVL